MAKKTNLDLSILPDNRPALKGDECLNCGTPLDKNENFCHYCGQRNDRRRLSFWEFISESIRSYFSVDSKVVHSLRPLLFKPGKLTREFIDGRRQQYVHPIRMYLTVSIVYFTLISLSSMMGRTDLELVSMDESKDSQFVLEMNGAEAQKEHSTLQDTFSSQIIEHADSIKEDLNSKVGKQIMPFPTSDSLETNHSQNAETQINWWDTIPNPGPYLKPQAYYLHQNDRLDRIISFNADQDSIPVDEALEFLELKNNRLNRFIYREVQKGRSLEWKDFFKFFASKLPIITFLFLPLFALSFWAVYYRRNFFYIEHLIFLFHVQTVFFLILLTRWLINFSFPNLEIGGILMLLFGVYAYLAMKRFYNQSHLKTVLKFILVHLGFWVLGTAFGILTFLITFLVY